MEGMQTRENIEFSVEYGRVADVAALARIDGDMFIPLAALLVSKLFCIVSVFFNLSSQTRYLLFIVFETVAQMFFHFFYFGLLRESFEQVFNLEPRILSYKL